MNEHLEFVVEFKGGTRDWVDPVQEVNIHEDFICVWNEGKSSYGYDRTLIDKWTIRPYTPETTYDPIEEEVHEIQLLAQR